MPGLPRLVDVDRARTRYGAGMQKTLRVLMYAGIGLALVGLVGGAIGYSMDSTYPEEFPGWAPPLIWIGVLVAVGAGITRGLVKNQR